MNKIKKIIIAFLISAIALANLALAQDTPNLGDSGTILPMKSQGNNCDSLINTFNNTGQFEKNEDPNKTNDPNETLGCAITTGRVSLPMVPYFIKYFSNYLLGIVSMVSLLFTVIGGFLYTAGGAMQDKDKGKKFIMNAIKGMILAFLAWSIVNVILSAVTG